jgi:hypothetical protein
MTSDLQLVLTLAPRVGPLRSQLVLNIDAPGSSLAPCAMFRIDATLPEFYVRHDELLDFCSAVVGIIQARRPRGGNT